MPEAADGLETAARTIRYQRSRSWPPVTAGTWSRPRRPTIRRDDPPSHPPRHGIHGLAGIPRARPLGESRTLIRPLLGLRRSELLTYLADLGQPYRSDSSNADPRFTRNRLRHQLLPLLAAQFKSGVVEALLRLARWPGKPKVWIGRCRNLARGCVLRRGSGPIRIQSDHSPGSGRYLPAKKLLIATCRDAVWPCSRWVFSNGTP